MKNKKEFLIILSVVAIIVLMLILLSACKRDGGNETVNPNLNANVDNVNNYVEEFENDMYGGRVVESDTKEYITLFIETKLYEGTEKLNITYDSGKYILNTANPVVSDVKAEVVEDVMNRKQFEIELEPITNYSISFIKKNLASEPTSDDIDVNEI